MGTQRIVSRVGDGTAAIFQGKSPEPGGLRELQQQDLMNYASQAGIKTVDYAEFKASDAEEELDGDGSKAPSAVAIYYYHPDHLGTNTLLTDMTGKPYQLFLNLPFGETMAEQFITGGAFQSKWKFNGKELDTETGLYYYGARCYDPRTSVWLGVDLLTQKYPNLSPYVYCYNNPVGLIDPNGKEAVVPGGDPPYFQIFTPEQNEKYGPTAGKLAFRFFTPFEDIYGAFSGKDFDGNSYNRAEAGTWAILGIVPFSKLAEGLKLVATSFKYSDDVSKLVKFTGKVSEDSKEIITLTKTGSFGDAKAVVKDVVGDMGKDAKDYVSTTGKGTNPFYNKAVGKQSADGKKYWRIDVDQKTSQAHINWVNGKQKGSIPFNGGFDQAKRIIDNKVF